MKVYIIINIGKEGDNCYIPVWGNTTTNKEDAENTAKALTELSSYTAGNKFIVHEENCH